MEWCTRYRIHEEEPRGNRGAGDEAADGAIDERFPDLALHGCLPVLELCSRIVTWTMAKRNATIPESLVMVNRRVHYFMISTGM